MPDDMSAERQRRSRSSDEFEFPKINKEILPGVMEAGQAGGGGANWEKRFQVAQALDDSEAYRLAIKAAEEALEQAMDNGAIDEYRKIKGALEAMRTKLAGEATAPASAAAPAAAESATRRAEIPKTERAFRLFLREKIREVVRLTSSDEALTIEVVRNKVIQGLGFDPKTFVPVNLFPTELGNESERSRIREEVEGEIYARCLLRAAELKEQSYKAMADKGAAVNRYLNDMKGSESGGASAAIVDRETFLWLKDLEDFGDGLSRDNVDRAFTVFLMLGEREPDFSEPWLSPFEKYRSKKRKVDGSWSWGTNYYDPSYDRSQKAEALAEVETKFGKDATALAWQLFQAFKEEANYNWQHYLSRDFTFASNRHALATQLTPPVYIGSRRVYLESVGTFRDELQRVALSPLHVKTKIGEDPDPTPDDLMKTRDRLDTDVYFNRARRGVFLADSPFEDQNIVKEGRLPQQLSFNTLKDGEKFRAAVVTIGELGKDADKGSKIGSAVGALGDLRSLGQSLVEAGTMTQKRLDKQIEIEARNIIWELSVENPNNVQDLAVQAKGKQNFLTPSGLNALFQAMGGKTREGYALVGSNEAFRRLRGVVLQIRSKSWEVFDDLAGEDEALEAKEKHSKDAISLPEARGMPLVDEIGKVNKFLVKATRPIAAVVGLVADILFPKAIFKGRRKR